MSSTLTVNDKGNSPEQNLTREGPRGADNEGFRREFRGGFRGRGSFRGVNRRRGSFHSEHRGRGSFRGELRGRGSFRGELRGRGSFRGEHRGRGSFRGEHRGRGSFRGEHRGRGSFRGEHRGRGSFRGEHRGRGSFRGEHRGRGSFRGEHRGRGSFRGEHRGRGSFHGEHRGREVNDTVRRKMMHLGFITIFPKDTPLNLLKTCVREDKNYEKCKHLFEDLRSDSFPNKLKTFNNLSLPEAIKLTLTSSDNSLEGCDSKIKEAVKNLPPPTLREAIIEAKFNVLNCSKDGIIHKIRDRHFPRKLPHTYLILKKEIKDLSGVGPYFIGRELSRVLSDTGWCIVKVRSMDYIYNIHQRAADYIVQHPEVCNYISLGTLEL